MCHYQINKMSEKQTDYQNFLTAYYKKNVIEDCVKVLSLISYGNYYN